MGPERIVLRGEIDIASAVLVRRTLRQAAAIAAGDLVVDCSDVAFMDAAGIEALVRTMEHLWLSGRSMRLLNPSPAVRRVIALAGVEGIFAIEAQDVPTSSG